MMIKTLCPYNRWLSPSIGRKSHCPGKKIRLHRPQELRLRIGECSSEIRDIIHNHETVKDIVLSGRFASIGLYETPAPKDHERAAYLLDFLGLSDKSDRRFMTLSDGEKQKVLLARALMPQPELLVLDEPCAGLDLKAREEFLDAVQEMCTKKGGPALIYITHHIEEIIPAITHALTLRNRMMIASGRKEDVLTNEVLSETFEVPIELQEREGRIMPVILKG